MYIEKRMNKDGTLSYRVRIRVKGKPERSLTFSTRKEAKARGQEMEAELKARKYFPSEEAKNRSFSEFVARYIERELPKNPKGEAKAKQHLLWWEKYLGKYFLNCVSPSMLAELRDKLMAETTFRGALRTGSTANRYLATLSKAFTIAVKEWHWLTENPLLKISRPKEGKPKDRFLDKDEVGILLAACKKVNSPHLFPFVFFALSTGARKGEILGLRWEDVDFKRSVAIFRDTKNGESRSVSLNSSLVMLIQEERQRRGVCSSFVFSSKDGTRPADIQTAWNNAIKLSGLKGVTIHTLRHTCASFLAQNGVSTLEIGAILGHKSLAMVKRYTHFSTSATARALNQMHEEILGEYLDVG